MDKSWREWSREIPSVRYVEVKRPEWNHPIMLDLERDEPGALTIGMLLWRECSPEDAAKRYALKPLGAAYRRPSDRA